MWVGSLDRWSHKQGQPRPYNGDRRFHKVNEGGSTDRSLPIIVRLVARNVELNVAAIQRTVELEANSEANTNRIRNLKVARGRAMRDNEALQ